MLTARPRVAPLLGLLPISVCKASLMAEFRTCMVRTGSGQGICPHPSSAKAHQGTRHGHEEPSGLQTTVQNRARRALVIAPVTASAPTLGHSFEGILLPLSRGLWAPVALVSLFPKQRQRDK